MSKLTPEDRIRMRLPGSEALCRAIGSTNWVLHRRTKRMIEKYGPDVVCLTQKSYDAAVDRALADEFPPKKPVRSVGDGGVIGLGTRL